MKKLEMNINIPSDKSGESKMILVFDPNMTTEVFKSLQDSVTRLQEIFEKHGLITKVGVSPAEMPYYIEYMKPIIADAEESIKELYMMKDSVKNSKLVTKYAIVDVIQDKIDEAWVAVDEFYEMFEEMGTYQPNVEFTKPFEVKDSE